MARPRNQARGTPEQRARLQTLKRRLSAMKVQLISLARNPCPAVCRRKTRPDPFDALIIKYQRVEDQIKQLEKICGNSQ